jgi:hypothetical protein
MAVGHRIVLANSAIHRALVTRGEDRTLKRFVVPVCLSLLCMLPCRGQASDFDECVVTRIKDAISDFAAIAIKSSCVRLTERDLPDSVHLDGVANYGQIPGVSNTFGLMITVNNNSGFHISGMTVVITDKKSGKASYYKTEHFMSVTISLESLGISHGLPPDPTALMIIGPGRRLFGLEISETAVNNSDFFARYSWNIIGLKGWKD